MIFIAIILIFLAILYTIVPYIFTRWAGLFVFKKGSGANNIALTFDDGPNPKYTNELLDLLEQFQVRASFFVVGKKAQEFPEIIQRMHNEGHLIGIHNYIHHSNWLMSPWKVKQGIEKSAKIIESIIGIKSSYYRPPWGMMNIFDLFIHRKYHIILWSLLAYDWNSKGGIKKIETRLLKGIKPGDIILLHDNGETWGADEDAPQYTIGALKLVLPILIERGYTFKRVDEMI